MPRALTVLPDTYYNVAEKGGESMDANILVVDDEAAIAYLVDVYLKS